MAEKVACENLGQGLRVARDGREGGFITWAGDKTLRHPPLGPPPPSLSHTLARKERDFPSPIPHTLQLESSLHLTTGNCGDLSARRRSLSLEGF